MSKAQGLKPIYTHDSKILILGTFPSEKSRETGEYYADSRNKFWPTICECLGVAVPTTYEAKEQLLKDHQIALWDLVESCDIDGSKDRDIKNPVKNDVGKIMNESSLELIILNGKSTLKMLRKLYGVSRAALFGATGYIWASSTSGANSRFNKNQWLSLIPLR